MLVVTVTGRRQGLSMGILDARFRGNDIGLLVSGDQSFDLSNALFQVCIWDYPLDA